MTRTRKPSRSTLSVLLVLRDNPEGRHGYSLMQATGLASGSLYPILMRLSERGWVEKQAQPSEHEGRPPRQVYRLTTKGRLELAALTATSQNLRGIRT